MVSRSDWTLISSSCPHCGEEVVGTVGVLHHEPPRPCDVTICPCCFGVSAFDEEFHLRSLTAKEQREVGASVPIRAAISHLRRITA